MKQLRRQRADSARDLFARRLGIELLEDRRLLSASVGNLAWNDLDADGIQDAGEPGLAGVAVELFGTTDSTIGNADDFSIGQRVSDASGNYSFTGLTEGINYYLVFRAPVGATGTPYTFATKDANGNTRDTADSDANSNGATDIFALSAGQNRADLDAGLTGAAPGFGFALQSGAGGGAGAVASDSAGNVCVTGVFARTTDFDPGPGVYSLTPDNSVSNVFVAKYTSSGALVWARHATGTSNSYQECTSIAVGGDGAVYTTGRFKNTADFDPGTGTSNLTSAGADDVFVWKLDASGNFVWVRQLGGTGYEDGIALALGSDGAVCITGEFESTVDFDPGPGTFNLTAVGDDIFTWKLDASGNFVWARQQKGASGNESGRSIAVGSDGAVYTTGWFQSTVDFNPGAGTCNFTSNGISDAFVSKLDASGNFIWAHQLGGAGWDSAYGIASDSDGAVYITGYFQGTADFDPGVSTFNLTSNGNSDTFVWKLDASGNFVWARNMGGTIDEIALGIALSSDGAVCFTGYFRGTADFDPGPGTFNLVSNGGYDAFASKLDASGNLIWARQLGGTSDDYGHGIALGGDGAVYTTGSFAFTVDFDPGPGTFNLSGNVDGDAFVRKFNAGHSPVDLLLSAASVVENQLAGTVVGVLSSVDVDLPNDTFTFSLVSGTGSTNNASFAIDGNQLKTTASFDFEAKRSYSVRIRTTDQEGLWIEKQFTISVLDVNETPNDLSISASNIAENQPSGTTIGIFSTTDPDAGDTFTYTLISGTGDTDNAGFTIDGNELKTAASLDHEAKSSYSIRVRTTDQEGLWIEKQFTISVLDVKETPNDLSISASNIAENQPSGTTVGTFSTTDPDIDDNFIYALVSGTGDTDNAGFTIDGNELKTAASLDYEAKSSYSIRIRTTDQEGLWIEKQFTISALDVNEVPTDLSISAGSIAENQPSGTTIGTFSTTDPDAGDTFTYTLISGTGDTDNAGFTIDGTELKTAASLDYETKNIYDIRVRSTDAGGGTYDKSFTISVTNVNEAPLAVADGYTLDEDASLLLPAPGVLTNDSDPEGDPLSASVVTGPAHGLLTLNGDGSFRYQPARDYNGQDSFTYQVSDGSLSSNAATVTITITAVNDLPTLAGIETAPVGYLPKQPATQLTSTLTASDVDDTVLAGGTVQITSGYQNGQDLLLFNDTGTITSTWNAATGTLSLMGNDTLANYQAALWSVEYQDTSANPSLATRTIRFTVNDGQIESNVVTRDVVFDPPVLSGVETKALTYTEKKPAVALSAKITLKDGNSPKMAGATVQIAGNYQPDQDVLSLANTKRITATWDPVTGTLALTGSDTVANYQKALRAVKYRNTSVNPNTATRTVSFQVSDGLITSSTATRGLTVKAVNDAPVLLGMESTALGYVATDPAAAITSSVTVTDVDSSLLTGATIKIAGGYKKGQDVLVFANTATITGTWSAAKGILTLKGLDTPAAYQEALRSIGFQNGATKPTVGWRKISFTVTDGLATSKTLSRWIVVAKYNPANASETAGLLDCLASLRPAQSAQTARQTLFASVQNWAVS